MPNRITYNPRSVGLGNKTGKMRKTIFVLTLAILVFGGILQWQKMQHVLNIVPVSNDYVKGNMCAQNLLWFPIGSVYGIAFLLFPRKTIEWFIKPLPQKEQKYILTDFHFGALRFFGFVLAIPTFISVYINCFEVFQNLFSR